MNLRSRKILPGLAMGAFLIAGCGTANEDEVAKASTGTVTGNAPQYKSYAEFAKAQTEAHKKQAESEKGAKGATRRAK
jgi:hypothetical protein